MKIEVEDLLNYHCPRWNELPEIELYIDQVTYFLQKNLSVFTKDKENPIITSSMINNYVKQNILEPPIKKKYNRQHLSYLFVICILKRLMSISEIGDSIVTMNLLKDMRESSCCYLINYRESIYKEANTAGFTDDKVILSKRTLDKNMLRLNSQGFLNGHTPFSAIVAFSAVIAAYINGKNLDDQLR